MKLLMMAGHSREAAAHVVSRELGHHRTEILNWYIDSTSLVPVEAQRLA